MDKKKLEFGIGLVMESISGQIKDVGLSLPIGCFLRRNVIDSLSDKKLWHSYSLTEEYLKILDKKSKLSSTERRFIKSIGDDAMKYLNKE